MSWARDEVDRKQTTNASMTHRERLDRRAATRLEHAPARTLYRGLTGSPLIFKSSRSLTLPPTTQAIAPRDFIRRARIPPKAAHDCPSGCSIMTIVPAWTKSTQCWLLGTTPASESGRGLVSEFLATSLRVEADPMILGCWSIEPIYGEHGAYGTGKHQHHAETLKKKLTDVNKASGTGYFSRIRLLQFQECIRDLLSRISILAIPISGWTHITGRICLQCFKVM